MRDKRKPLEGKRERTNRANKNSLNQKKNSNKAKSDLTNKRPNVNSKSKIKKEDTYDKPPYKRKLNTDTEEKSFRSKKSSKTNKQEAIRETKNAKQQHEYSSWEKGKSNLKRKEENHHQQKKKSIYRKATPISEPEELIRLNKYLANAGICSRREADKLIQTGAVSVNGKIVTELGYKVKPGDKVVYGGERIRSEKKVYILLNKPKDYITTTDDPQARKTVMDLIKGACKERVYPVGRLDRNTTGVLLLTNDGELTKKLLHPKHGIAKVYHVTLDKNISREDMQKLYEGFELEDGFTKVDNIAYVSTSKSKKEVGVEIHSGKNRIVRRMFEHLGYTVVKLDRVSFAGLTKKDLSRGKYRFLTEKEIGFLKMIS